MFEFKLNYGKINIIVVTGTRGTGKTQLANYFAAEFRKHGRFPMIIEEGSIPKKIIPSARPLVLVGQGIKVHQNVLMEADVIVNASVIDFDRTKAFYNFLEA